jgi:hypothetical protein
MFITPRTKSSVSNLLDNKSQLDNEWSPQNCSLPSGQSIVSGTTELDVVFSRCLHLPACGNSHFSAQGHFKDLRPCSASLVNQDTRLTNSDTPSINYRVYKVAPFTSFSFLVRLTITTFSVCVCVCVCVCARARARYQKVKGKVALVFN